MDLIAFAFTTVMISLSGVMMPGPMFAVTLAEGKKNRYAGFEISAGHAFTELPIIALLFLSGTFLDIGVARYILFLSGGVVMIYLAYSELKKKHSELKIKGILSGILLSALNPYFIMWWLTVGFSLVILASQFGIFGILALTVIHLSCDFGWYGFLSLFSGRISESERVKRTLSYVSSAILIIFGIYFIYLSAEPLLLYF